jgi:hypothetical protein
MQGRLITAGSTLVDAAYVAHPQTCASLAMLRTSGGSFAYPGLTANGGVLFGLPMLASSSCPSTGIALIDGGQLLVADESGVEIAVSDEALIQQDSAPSGTSTLISLFSSDSVGLRIVRTINWQLARTFVAYATNVSLPAATAPTV